MKKVLIISGILIAVFTTSYSVLVKSKPADIAAVSIKRDESIKDFLIKAGFKKVAGIKSYSTDIEKSWWFNKYGLHWLSYEEMDTLMKQNNFIIGAAENYIDSIPDAAAITMRENYKAVSPELLTWRLNPYLNWVNTYWFTSYEIDEPAARKEGGQVMPEYLNALFTESGIERKNKYDVLFAGIYDIVRDNALSKIFVVADKSKFDIKGMEIVGRELRRPIAHDPIAVIKHRTGYVILAKWD